MFKKIKLKYLLILGVLLTGIVIGGCTKVSNNVKADDTSTYNQKIGQMNVDDSTTVYIYNDKQNNNIIYVGFDKQSRNALSIHAIPVH